MTTQTQEKEDVASRTLNVADMEDPEVIIYSYFGKGATVVIDPDAEWKDGDLVYVFGWDGKQRLGFVYEFDGFFVLTSVGQHPPTVYPKAPDPLSKRSEITKVISIEAAEWECKVNLSP